LLNVNKSILESYFWLIFLKHKLLDLTESVLLSFIKYAVHTGWITNTKTIHVSQFLDGLSPHTWYGYEFWSSDLWAPALIKNLTINAHQFNNHLDRRSITKRTNVCAKNWTTVLNNWKKRSTNWAINHWLIFFLLQQDWSIWWGFKDLKFWNFLKSI
jgi:hypothetical protein